MDYSMIKFSFLSQVRGEGGELFSLLGNNQVRVHNFSVYPSKMGYKILVRVQLFFLL